MDKSGQTDIIKLFTDILDKLNIPYAIGGSIASSLYGRVRFTQDADITVMALDDKIDPFYSLTKPHFYISKSAMHQAVRNKTSFNVIHTKTAFKLDVFVAQNNEFNNNLIRRAKKIKLSEDTEKTFSVVSAEDIILLKLDWFKRSDCTSERQWSDILGVLSAQASSLDFEYLKTWAAKLGLAELLNKVILNSHKK
jgi:hypothetical protein